MKNDRLFRILYILLEKGFITAPELASQLEVSVRTVYRDVEALSMAGVPLCTTAGKGGGISLMSGYALDKALFSDEEQDQILFALQSLKATDQKVDNLLLKLNGVFKKQNSSWIEVDFSRWGLGRVDNQRFEIVKNAILQKRVLGILYCGMSGEFSERMIKPFKLIFKDKSWYLQAICMKAEDYRLFKVSRILEIQETDRYFSEDFEDAPRLEIDMPPGLGTRIKLLFSPAVAFRVYDEFDRSCIEKQPDGSMLVTVYFPSDDWVIGYILSFGADVDILEPPELKQGLIAYTTHILEHYRT